MPNEQIRPKLKALAEFAAGALTLSVAGPARLHQYHNGRTVVFDPPRESFGGSFSVSMSGDREVQVSPGTVNHVVPKIGRARIDGFDDDGKRLKTGIPKLKLPAPGDNLRSYVAIRIALDPATGEMNPEDPDALQVVHLPGLDAASIAGGYPDDGEGVGYDPLVEAEWHDRKRIKRFRRIVYYDRAHLFQPGEGDRPGRHLFYASS